MLDDLAFGWHTAVLADAIAQLQILARALALLLAAGRADRAVANRLGRLLR